MAKLTLTDITTTNIVTTYNANNDLIEAAIENTLSRDGTTPNQMQADLDMNSNRILNVADILYVDGTTQAVIDWTTTEYDFGEIAAGDLILVYDADAGVAKTMKYRTSHYNVITESTTSRTMADDDCNAFIKCTNGSATTLTINSGVGGQGAVFSVGQWGAGAVTVAAGGGVTLRAANGPTTAAQYSVLNVICVATDEWVVTGDATT